MYTSHIATANDTVSVGPDPFKEEQSKAVISSHLGQDTSILEWTREPVFLRWSNISLTVPQPRKKSTKTVLSSVSGSVRPGQMLAIMGASGSGKTSLLKILAGRLDSQRATVSGKVYVNGEPRDINTFRYQQAYVDQEDAFFGELTVYEEVSFSAGLRLPAKMDPKEKVATADRVLAELGLNEVRDTRIGGKFVRGVSGGERKRVSIATEIVAHPSVLFLDEPTTGLDSRNALNVMKTLRRLATNHRTVLCTLHQPQSAIFALIDQLLLLSEGRVMYQGPAHLCLPYFSGLGFHCPPAYNPADFLIDLTAIDCRSVRAERITKTRVKYIAERLPLELDVYRRPKHDFCTNKRSKSERQFENSYMTELIFLTRRELKLLLRSKFRNTIRFFQNVVFAVLLGMVWLSKGRHYDEMSRRSIPGILFFIAINQSGAGFGLLYAFPLERIIITRERASNMYRPSSYVLVKSLIDLTKTVVFVLLFCSIVYPMVGLRAGFGAFLRFSIAVLAMTVFAESLSYCVSFLTGNVSTSSSLLTMLIVLSLLFGGFFIDVKQMPSWLAPFKWISCMYYTFNAMMDVEFPPHTTDQIVNVVRNEAGLNSLSYWENILVLLGMTGCLKIISYFLLKYLRAPKFLKF